MNICMKISCLDVDCLNLQWKNLQRFLVLIMVHLCNSLSTTVTFFYQTKLYLKFYNS
jgi:hypothetical protein